MGRHNEVESAALATLNTACALCIMGQSHQPPQRPGQTTNEASRQPNISPTPSLPPGHAPASPEFEAYYEKNAAKFIRLNWPATCRDACRWAIPEDSEACKAACESTEKAQLVSYLRVWPRPGAPFRMFELVPDRVPFDGLPEGSASLVPSPKECDRLCLWTEPEGRRWCQQTCNEARLLGVNVDVGIYPDGAGRACFSQTHRLMGGSNALKMTPGHPWERLARAVDKTEGPSS